MANTRGLAKFDSERRASGKGRMRTRRPKNVGYRPQLINPHEQAQREAVKQMYDDADSLVQPPSTRSKE